MNVFFKAYGDGHMPLKNGSFNAGDLRPCGVGDTMSK